jgi:hypothetical protein
MGGQWSDRARSVVSEWQERAYGELAEDLGWGWSPQRAFDKFATRQVAKDDYRLSVDRLKANFGSDYDPGLDWQEVEKGWNEYKEHYYYIEPPTKYEDASIYSNAFANLTAITTLIEQVMPGQLTKVPLIASLPSGELTAKLRSIRGTNEVVILLQKGLAGFIFHFTNIIACAIPTDLIRSGKPVPSATYGIPGDAKHVTYATKYLIDLIDAYIVNGDPHLLSDPDLRGRALYNRGVIGIWMRQFPICHELIHLVYGHLGSRTLLSKDEAWRREYQADCVGSALIAGLSNDYDPESRLTSIWACAVVLAGFGILEECIDFLSPGSRLAPESGSHPPFRKRREGIFQFACDNFSASGYDDDARSLEDLFNKGEEILGYLMNRIGPHLEELRRNGVRPSPIWRIRQVPES